MPQIRLEYSSNCAHQSQFNILFSEIHQILSQVGGINHDNCKSRAIRLDDFFIADGSDKHGFAHLSIRFIEGRDESIRRQIGDQCLERLKRFFGTSTSEQQLQLTVEVQEIRLGEYHKYPEGTLTRQA